LFLTSKQSNRTIEITVRPANLKLPKYILGASAKPLSF
jgi:hypothetical protein